MSEQKNTTSKPTNQAQAQVHVGNMADNCCDDHLDEEVRFFCEDCNVLICDECVQSIHKTHDFKSFKKVVKEFMDIESKDMDKFFSGSLSEEHENAIKQIEAVMTKEITRFKAQAEKIVNKINQIRDQKEREIQKMTEENIIALNQMFVVVDDRFTKPVYKLKQLTSEPGRTNDREAVRIIMRLKDLTQLYDDKRLEQTVCSPTFVATEIDENVIEKLFGELVVKKHNMREFLINEMK